VYVNRRYDLQVVGVDESYNTDEYMFVEPRSPIGCQPRLALATSGSAQLFLIGGDRSGRLSRSSMHSGNGFFGLVISRVGSGSKARARAPPNRCPTLDSGSG
jgi:hypothetical protein